MDEMDFHTAASPKAMPNKFVYIEMERLFFKKRTGKISATLVFKTNRD